MTVDEREHVFIVMVGAYDSYAFHGAYRTLQAALDAAKFTRDMYGWQISYCPIGSSKDESVCWTDGRQGEVKWENGWTDPTPSTEVSS
jgi:hypothetical protein